MAKEKKPTQNDRVLEYIKDFGFITTWQAIQDLGVTRLAARIADLEEQGYCFAKRTLSAKNRYGDNTHFTEYRLVEVAK